MKREYSHRSNGDPKSQKGRNKTHVRYDNEDTGNMSLQDKLDEGVESLEPFNRQDDDYLYPRIM